MFELRRSPVVGSVLTAFLATACDPGNQAPDERDAGPAVAVPRDPAPVLDEVALETRSELVDDLEDQDVRFRLPDGEGYWSAGQGPAEFGLAPEADGANETSAALHALADGAAGSVVAHLCRQDASASVAHDYSSCEGLEFWARLGSTATNEADNLVVAVESDSGVSRATVRVSSAWKRYTLAWDAFGAAPAVDGAGAGGGSATEQDPGRAGAAGHGADTEAAAGSPSSGTATSAVEPSTIETISFEQSALTDLWLDEVRLTDCELPLLNPPIPDPPKLGTAGPEGSPVARWGQLQVDGNQLLDQSGTPVQLRGVSTQWLELDYSGIPESLEALRWMRDNWKLSLLRIAMGVEDNSHFLTDCERTKARVRTIVENAIELGVYVIVDWHSHNATEYIGQARAFFTEIAEAYGDHPNVIYETFNEPEGGVNESESRVMWSTVLKPYHQSVVSAIRRADPDNLIVLGTPLWSQRVADAAADPVRAANVLYTLHFYSCTHKDWNRQQGDRALALGAALFVTEWGATDADGGRGGELCLDEARVWLDWMAEHNISGAAWKLYADPDSSAILRSTAKGGWTDDDLHGHGPFVRDWLLE
ncbi:MAG: cellulase family glycosylhydrolase [Polyangiaceae bacterium]|nr:cellulase family glycosylhydrolase [Polyangiaceae bacterium]